MRYSYFGNGQQFWIALDSKILIEILLKMHYYFCGILTDLSNLLIVKIIMYETFWKEGINMRQDRPSLNLVGRGVPRPPLGLVKLSPGQCLCRIYPPPYTSVTRQTYIIFPWTAWSQKSFTKTKKSHIWYCAITEKPNCSTWTQRDW